MINKIKDYLNDNNIDAWVIYDYECHNDALVAFTGKKMFTRKIFMVIPSKDNPYIIAHKIDEVYLKDISNKFELKLYQTWSELLSLLKQNISQYQKVMMEITSQGMFPRSSYVDYGTVELIKSFGVNVVSSSDLLVAFNATYKQEALESQKRAMIICLEAKDKAFKHIEYCLKNNIEITEYQVVTLITDYFKANNLVYDSNPIVAVNANAGNPHYEPKINHSTIIKKGDLILIDLWAKEDKEEGVYADITWMAFAGKNPPKQYVDYFNVLRDAIANGLDFLNKELKVREVSGYEVDEAVRSILRKNKLDQYLIHRVGHSISLDDTPHGKGTNIDNYETVDFRHIIPNIGFSLEPGIYTPNIGLRSEIDVYIDENKNAFSVGERQLSLILLDVD